MSRPRVGASLLILVASVQMVTSCSVGRPADDASGAEIYTQLCSNCHGDDLGGGLGPALGPESNSASEPDEFLEFTITNGRGRMPSFSSSLEQHQLERLVSYIRGQQGQ